MTRGTFARGVLWAGLAVLVAVAAGAATWRLAKPPTGYADRVSYAPGETARLYVDAGLWPAPRALVVRRGDGRAVDTVRVKSRWQATQDSAWARGFGWRESGRFRVPLTSGLYRAAGTIPFVVRPAPGQAEVLVVYPSNTIAAYAQHGGRSLYVMNRWARLRAALARLATFRWRGALPDAYAHRARQVAFQRPTGTTHWAYFEPFVGWMARQGVPAGWIADADLDDPAVLDGVRVLVLVGHSEYWTRRARRHVDAFVARGGHLLVLGGNVMWWQVRYDARGNLVCYKEPGEDPTAVDSLRTLTWDTPALHYPIEASLGAAFPHGGFGRDVAPGFRLVDASGPLFENVPLPADSLYRGPAVEMDGAPLRAWHHGRPVADTAALGFHRFRLLGYRRGERFGEPTAGTMHVFQKTPSSGWVFQVGSTDWAGATFRGPDSVAVQALTRRALELMHAGAPLL